MMRLTQLRARPFALRVSARSIAILVLHVGLGCSAKDPIPADPAQRDAGPLPDRSVAVSDATTNSTDVGAETGVVAADETLTAKVDTYLKVSAVDSSTLAPEDKCFIAKGTKVAISQIVDAGTHTAAKLVSTHNCGANFVVGSSIFLFTAHFTGWSSVPDAPAPVTIVDNPANYAASCQYRAANRTRTEIKRIILHNTEGRWVNFKSAWQSCDRIGAAHFVVLRTGVVMRTIPEKNVAYHATVANTDTLGVEIESGPGFEGMTAPQEASVIALTKKLQAEFGAAPAGIGTSGVTMHRLAAPGSTDCATYIWPKDSEFTAFRDANF
jgi:N-acetylmuramoyl-L-alanine amidase